jgi:hypothetical protein
LFDVDNIVHLDNQQVNRELLQKRYSGVRRMIARVLLFLFGLFAFLAMLEAVR